MPVGLNAGKKADDNPRYTIDLNGPQWHMMRDTAASWENDRLYLPDEATDLSVLPVNPPTGGWTALDLSLIHISEPTRPY